jgi:outer membrane receptor protein involved in Fe transport
MTNRKSFTLTPVSAAIVTALGTSGAAAQDAGTDDLAIEEILVTATKREMTLQDIPHSIDVLSAVELQRMGAKDLESTLRALPSIGLVALQPGQNSLVVRGITTEPFEYRTDAQVAVYLDEQPMSSNSQQVGFRGIDMARVENLPGPQGTLFGASSQTGTIRYISNKPDFSGFSGQVEARYGNTDGGDDSHDINAILNVPLFDNKLAARLVAYSSEDGGYVDNVFGLSFSGNYDNADLVEKNHNVYSVDGARLHLSWNISDNWNALVSIMGENTEAIGAWDSDAALDDYQVTRFQEEVRTDDWTSGVLTLSGDLGFADLSFTYTNMDRDIVYQYDNMTYSQSKDYNYGYYCLTYGTSCLYYGNYYPSYIFNDQVQEREAYEMRLVSKGDSKLQWTVGAYYEEFLNNWFYGAKVPGLENTTMWAAAQAYAYYYGYPNYYNGYSPNPEQVYPLPLTDISYSNTFLSTVKQTAVFGEIGYDITDKLNVFGGLRWAEFDRDQYEKYDFPGGLLPIGDRSVGDGSFRSVSKEDDTIHKFGVRYQIDDDRMIYALKSQGFRVGGSNSPRSVGTGRVPELYKGDFLDNYEFGLKSTWMDDRLTLNASAFYMEWTDYLQGADFGDDGQWWLGGTVNAGGAETTGIEVQLRLQATERLFLSANIFNADAKFQDNFCNNFENGVKVPCETLPDGSVDPDDINIRKGQDMPNSPDTTFWASVYYEVPDVLGGDLWFYYDYSYTSETWNGTTEARDLEREGLAPSRNYSNLSMGMQWPNALDLELTVNNVTGEKGYSYVWRGEGGNADSFGDPRYQQQRAQDRPRTIWLTLRKGFGEQ